MRTTAAITAVHGYVPEFRLSNHVLETMVETNDAWITERTGIKERRILVGKDRGLSVMAIEAVNGLLKKRGIGPEEIDLMIVATGTPAGTRAIHPGDVVEVELVGLSRVANPVIAGT
jgi:3-oxoacyl-[acyl-carrier-protein] synthase-3